MEHDFVAEITGRLLAPPTIYDDTKAEPKSVLLRLQVTQQLDGFLGRRVVNLYPVLRAEGREQIEKLGRLRPGDPIRAWSRRLRPGRPFWVNEVDPETGQRGVPKAGREKYLIDHYELPPRSELLPGVFRVEIQGRAQGSILSKDQYGPYGHLQVLIHRPANHGRGEYSTVERFHTRIYGGALAGRLSREIQHGDPVKVVCKSFIKGSLYWDPAAGDGGAYAVHPPLLIATEISRVPGLSRVPGQPDRHRELSMLTGLLC